MTQTGIVRANFGIIVFCTFMLAILTGFATADVFIPDRVSGQELQVTPVIVKGADGTENISVRLEADKVLPLGGRSNFAQEYSGVDPNSVKAWRLKGDPALVLVKWNDYVEGMGRYQNEFLTVLRDDGDAPPLLSRCILISGRGGPGTGQWGDYRIRYEGDRLYVRISSSHAYVSREQRPLYYSWTRDDGESYFRSVVETSFTQVFKMTPDTFDLQSSLMEYKVQDGDTLDDICSGLNVKKEWVRNADLLEKGATVLQIEIPNEAAEQYLNGTKLLGP